MTDYIYKLDLRVRDYECDMQGSGKMVTSPTDKKQRELILSLSTR